MFRAGKEGIDLKKQIRIFMLYPDAKDLTLFYKFFYIHWAGFANYEFLWDENEPQYLVVTECIYSDENLWEKFKKLYRIAEVCIYRSTESIAPDLNMFDYAVCFDKHLSCDDRIGYIPNRLFYKELNLIFKDRNDLEGQKRLAFQYLQNKRHFCNFIYSNPDADKKRTEMFYKINEYKSVDSLGKYLNNKKMPMDVNKEDGWSEIIKASIKAKSQYKFSIACENACYVGYTSEKVFSSLEAHTVPIYWGNRFIEEEINGRAIINCHKYSNWDEVIDRIKEIDENDELWCDMICEPWHTKEQETGEKEEIERYYRFLNNIFMQPIGDAGRRGKGAHPRRYQDWFFQSNKFRGYYDVGIKLLKAKQDDKKLEGYFTRNGYREIAIYGMADIGNCLWKELKGSREVRVIYGIDQGMPKTEEDIRVYRLEDIRNLEQPDVVVVTLPHIYDVIEAEIKKYVECKIVSVMEVVGSM